MIAPGKEGFGHDRKVFALSTNKDTCSFSTFLDN